MKLTPITRRRLAIFRQNRRGYWSFWLFAILFGTSLFAELIANNRPLLIRFDGHWYVPVLQDYSEDTFGPDFLPTEADYTDPELQQAINAHGWMIWPAVPYSFGTIVKNLPSPAPSPPSARNPLGTDDQARDVLARVIYGFRLSVLFGFVLTVVSSAVGIAAGAVQGYYGGATDLLFQRFIEIWNGMPQLYLLIILGSIITPGFWVLLIFLLLFLDEPDRRGARRVPARPQSGLCARGEGARCRGHRGYVAAHPAQRDGCDADLPAVHAVGLGDDFAGSAIFLGLVCRRGRHRLANWWRRARTTCRRHGWGLPRSSCWAAC